MPSLSPSKFDDAEHKGAAPDDAIAFATHRFDSPHLISADRSQWELHDNAVESLPSARSQVVASRSVENANANNSPVCGGTAQRIDPISSDCFVVDPDAIRQAHEDDLIGHLQQWSEDLDQRSARLHADIATQERRERAFRLWMQNQRAEWESKMKECEQLQRNAEAVARRLAFSG